MIRYFVGVFLLFINIHTVISQPSLNKIRHEADDQSLILLYITENLTTFSTGNTGFTVTIDGSQVTFENPAYVIGGLPGNIIVLDITQSILFSNDVRVSYDNTEGGDASNDNGPLASFTNVRSRNLRTFSCNDFTNSGTLNLALSGSCSPVSITQQSTHLIKLAWRNSENFDASKMLTRFEWNDGANTIDDATTTELVFSPTSYAYQATESFTYPKENPCGYTLIMTPGYDANGDGDLSDGGDFLCPTGNGGATMEETRLVSAWENDNENTGTLQMDPILVEQCVNVPMDTLINDATLYNCRVDALTVPPDDPSFAHLDERYVRFTYGTNGGRKIPNIYVDGVQITDNNGDFIVATNALGGYEDPRGIITIPAETYPTEQGHEQTLSITMPDPGFEVIGDILEVTIENWNSCNWSGGTGTPITTTAEIEIVGAIDPTGATDGEYCEGEAVAQISVDDAPSGHQVEWYDDYDPNDPAVGTLVHTGTGTSGVWDAPPDLASPGTVTYYAQYVGTCPSENRTAVNLTKYSLPAIYNVTGGGTICTGGAGAPVGLDDSDSGVDYELWRDGSTLVETVAGTGSAISFTPQTTAGTYTVVADNPTTTCREDMNGSVDVIVLPAIDNNTIAADQTVCLGDTPATLTGSDPTGGDGSYTYLWEENVNSGGWNAAPGTNNQKNYDPPAQGTAGSVEYRRIVESGPCNGTTANTSSPVTITVRDDPTDLVASVDEDQLCYNDGATINLPSTDPTFEYRINNLTESTILMDWTAGTGGDINQPTGSLTQDTDYEIRIRYATNPRCELVSSTGISIDVNPQLIATASAVDTNICENEDIDLEGTYSGGTDPLTYIDWTGTDGFSDNVLDPDPFAPLSTGATYTYTLTIRDSYPSDATGYCEATDNVDVTVNTNPTVDIEDVPFTSNGPYTVCVNTDLNLTGNDTEGTGTITTRTWSGDVSILVGDTDPGTEDATVNDGTPGTYNLFYSVIDDQGCTATDNVDVTISGPTVSIDQGPAAGVCADTDLQLTVTETTSGGGIASREWTGNYDDGGGAVALTTTELDNLLTDGSGTSRRTENNPIFNTAGDPGLGTGDYELFYRATDVNGCTDYDTINIQVTQVMAAILYGFTSGDITNGDLNATLCSGEDLFLDGNPSGGTGTYDTHDWVQTAGPAATPLSADNIQKPVFNYTTATTEIFKFSYEVSDNGSPPCGFLTPPAEEITITVEPLPEANDQTGGPVCSDAAGGNTATVDLTVHEGAIKGASPGNTVTWYEDAGLTTLIADPANAVVTDAVPVYAEVDNGTCTDVAEVTYTVNTTPFPATNPVDNIACETDVTGATLAVDDPGAPLEITWWDASSGGSPAVGTVGGTNGELFTPDATATFTYYAQVENSSTGCVSLSRVAVEHTEDLQPSAAQADDGSTVTDLCGPDGALSAVPADNNGTGTWSVSSLAYYENFNSADDAGVGATGPIPNGTNDGVTSPYSEKWTVDVSGSALNDADRWFRVDTDGGGEPVFSGRHLGGEAIWYSQNIDISSFGSGVDIYVDLSRASGTQYESPADYIQVGYILDAGAEQTVSTNGLVTGDFSSPVTASETGLTGNDLQIVIRMNNSASDEYYYFDNVNVVANGVTPVALSDPNDPAATFTGLPIGTTTFTWTVTSQYKVCSQSSSTVDITRHERATINTQPVNAEVCELDATFFEIDASVTVATLTYQWQYSDDDGATWNNLSDGTAGSGETYSGVTTSRLDITDVPFTIDSRWFRVELTTDGLCIDYSDVAVLTVNPLATISVQPANTSVCENGSTSFDITASGPGLSYQWQLSTDGGSTWSDISDGAGGNGETYAGATTNQLDISDVPLANDTYQYKVVLTTTGPCTTESNAAVLTVNPLATISVQPVDDAICENGSTSFSVSASGPGLTYQWQYSDDNGTSWNDLSDGAGPNGETYAGTTTDVLDITNVPLANNNYQYRVELTTTGSCVNYSSAAILTVNEYATITTHPVDDVICELGDTFFEVTASGPGLAYQWQESTDGGSTWADVTDGTFSGVTYSGATTTRLDITTVAAGYDGYEYRVSLTTTGSCENFSNEAVLTVNPNPADATISDNSRCGTGAVTMTGNVGAGGDFVDFSEDGGSTVFGTDGTSPYEYSTSSIPEGTSITVHVRSRNSSTGCVSPWTNSAQATAYFIPDPATITDGERCGDGSVLMTGDVGANGNVVDFSEDAGATVHGSDGFDPYEYNTSVITAPGSITVHVRTRNSSTGCASGWDNSATATAKEGPTIDDFTGDEDVCVNETSKTYRVFVTSPGTPTYSWTLDPIDGNEPAMTTFDDIAVLDFGPNVWTGTLSVEVTDQGCTAGPAVKNITVYTEPAADAGPDLTVCSNGADLIGGSPSATGGSGSYIYSWSPSTDLDDNTLANPEVSINNTSDITVSRTYQLEVTDAVTGCVAPTDDMQVTAEPVPSLDATMNTSAVLCDGGTVDIDVTTPTVPTTPADLTWDLTVSSSDPGNTAGTAFAGLTGEPFPGNVNGTLVNTSSDVIIVSFTFTPKYAGCPDGTSETINVEVEPSPAADISTTTPLICEGENVFVTISAASDHTNNSDRMFDLAVTSTDDANLSGTASVNLSNQSYPHSITGTLTNSSNQVITVTYTVTPKYSGCSDGTPVSVNVDVEPDPVVTTTLNSPAAMCNGDNVDIDVTTPTIPSTPGDLSWDVSVSSSDLGSTGGTAFTDLTGQSFPGNVTGTLTNSSNNDITVTFTFTPKYDGCDDGTPVDVNVIVEPTPVMNAFLNTSATVCNGGNVDIDLTSPTTPSTPGDLTWDLTVTSTDDPATGGTAYANLTGQSFPGNVAGTLINNSDDDITVTFTFTPKLAGCADGTPVTVDVVVEPTPVMTATLNTAATICDGGNVDIDLASPTVPSTPGDLTWDLVVTSTDDPNTDGTAYANLTGQSFPGNVAGTLINNSDDDITVTFTFTPKLAGCADGTPVTVDVVVEPTPVMTATLNTASTICEGGNVDIDLASPTTPSDPADLTWDLVVSSTDDPSTGGTAYSDLSGQSFPGNINGTLTNSSDDDITVTFTFTPKLAGCADGTPVTVDVVVEPTPVMTATLNTAATICDGGNVDIDLASPTTPSDPADLTWDLVVSSTDDPATGGTAYSDLSGQSFPGNVAGTLINNSNDDITVTFTFTPKLAGCADGTPVTVDVTVEPTPVMTATLNTAATICNGDNVDIDLASPTVPSTPGDLTWDLVVSSTDDPNTDGTAYANLTGQPFPGNVAGTLINNSNDDITVTFTFTPKLAGCADGTPVTVDVVVEPTPVMTATLNTASTICEGGNVDIDLASPTTPSDPADLTWDLTVTSTDDPATGGTAYSDLSGQSFPSNVSGTLTNSSNDDITVTFTFTPKLAGCADGTPVTVDVTVEPTPAMTATLNTASTICEGGNVDIDLASPTVPSTPGDLTWDLVVSSTDDPATGGTAYSDLNGQSFPGNVSGTLTNSSDNDITVTFTFTPKLAGCADGTPVTVDVTVEPTPTMTATLNTASTICEGGNVDIDLASPTVPSTPGDLTWDLVVTSTDDPATGGTAYSDLTGQSFPGNVSGTLTNSSNDDITVTFTFTPKLAGCADGTPVTVDVVVEPTPSMTATLNTAATICEGGNVDIDLTSTTTPSTPADLTWDLVVSSTDDPATGGTAYADLTGQSFPGNVAGTLTNSSDNDITVTFTFTPKLAGCADGTSQVINVIVEPTPRLSANLTTSSTICDGGNVNIDVSSPTNPVNSADLTWDLAVSSTDDPNTGGTAYVDLTGQTFPGNVNGTLVNNSTSVITVTFTFTPKLAGCSDGTPVIIDVVVEPTPQANITTTTPVVCNGDNVDIDINAITGHTNNADRSFDLVVTSTDDANLGGVASLDLTNQNYPYTISGELTNSSDQVITVTYTVTPKYGSCADGPDVSLTVDVEPTPAADITTTTPVVCNGDNVNIDITATTDHTNNANRQFDLTVTSTDDANLGGTASVDLADQSYPLNISGTLTNSSDQVITVTYTVTPKYGTCADGNPVDITIDVEPTPAANIITTTPVVCDGDNVDIDITAISTHTNNSNRLFDLVVTSTDDANLSGSASVDLTDQSYPHTISGDLINSSDQVITVTYTVTPKYGSCADGAPVNLTVDVEPTPAANITTSTPVICNGDNVNIDITAVSSHTNNPNHLFDLTVTSTDDANLAGSAFADLTDQSYPLNISGDLINSSNDVITVTFTVTPKYSGCASGTPVSVTVDVEPTPAADITTTTPVVCNTENVNIDITALTNHTNNSNRLFDLVVSSTDDANLSGTASVDLNNQSYPLNISGTLINSSNQVITVTYTVTPKYGSCADGTPVSIDIDVEPTPAADITTTTPVICNGDNVSIDITAVTDHTNNPGRLFDLVVTSTDDANLSGSAAADLSDQSYPLTISGDLVNSSNDVITVTYTVTPEYGTCSDGSTVSVNVDVEPSPVAVATPASETICSDDITNITITSPTNPSSGVITFDFTAVASGGAGDVTGFTASGNDVADGFVLADQIQNNTSEPQTVTYTFTPKADDASGGAGCTGTPLDVVVTVNPVPDVVSTTLAQSICDGGATDFTLTTNTTPTANVTFDYVVTAPPEITGYTTPVTGLTDGTTVNTTLGTSSSVPETATYTITPYFDGCAGSPIDVDITVNPLPMVDISGSEDICLGNSADMPVTLTQGTGPFTIRYSSSTSGNITEVNNLNSGDIVKVTPDVTGTTVYRITYIEDANGCSVSGNPVSAAGDFIVNVSPELTAYISTTKDEVCAGDDVVIKFNLDGGVGPFDVTIEVNGTPETLTDISDGDTKTYNPLISTIYELTDVVDNGFTGCEPNTFGSPVEVTVYDYPTAHISGDNTICENDTVTLEIELTGTGPWDVRYTDDGGVSKFLIPSIEKNGTPTIHELELVPEVGTTVYELVDVRDFGSPIVCIGTVANGNVTGSATVDVNALPTASILGTTDICNGDDTNIAFSLTGSGPFDVEYSDGDTDHTLTGISDGHTVTVSPDTTTTYSLVSVTDSNTPGCGPEDLSSEVVITVNNLPTATLTSDTLYVCDGTEVELLVDLSGDAPFTLEYEDNLGNQYTEVINASSAELSHTPPAGEVVYSLISVTDSNNPVCSGPVSGETRVIVNELPTAYLSVGGVESGNSSVQICEGESATLTFRFTGTQPYRLQYEINSGTITTVEDINSDTYTVDVSPEFTSRYRIVSIEDGNNPVCSGTFSGVADVVVEETPVADFNVNNLEGCAPLDVFFDNFSTGNLQGENTGYYYREKGETAMNLLSSDLFTSFTFENNSDTVKTYEVFFIAETSLGCADTTGKEIHVSPSIQLDITRVDPEEGCNPYTVEFANNNPMPGTQYIWQWGDGEASDTTTTETSVTHTFVNSSVVSAKTFVVTVTGINPATGCEQSMVHNVRVNSDIVLDVEADVNEGCGPLFVNASNNSQGVSTHTWFYRVKGVDERQEEVDTPFATWELRNQTDDALTYELIYIAENRFGCQESDTLEVVVWPELNASFVASPERQILPNTTIELENNTNAGPWDYSWDFGDGSTSDDPELQEYSYETYGNYQILLTVSFGPCEDTHSESVVIEPITPVVDFTADITEGCRPLTVNFINNSQFADEDSYYWEFGDDLGFSNAEDPTFTFYDPGVYRVSLEATNDLGIVVREEKEMYITVFETPVAQFTVRPKLVYIPDQPVYTSNLSYGATQFLWDFGVEGTTDDTSTEEEPIYTYTQTGVYDISLWVVNDEGCEDSVLMEQAVVAEEGGDLNTPNVFTPNPDGPTDPGGGGGGTVGAPAYNDIFLPVERGVVEFHMQIFNRWGELLFESFDKNIGWNGYYKGKLAPSDVYIYRLDLKLNDGRQVTRLGDVMLVR